jgi:protein-disulfide isomerase
MLLAGELGHEEAADVQRALEARPDLREATERLRALEEATRQLATNGACDEGLERAIERALPPPRRRGPMTLLAAAAAAVLLLAAATLWRSTPSPREVASAPAQPSSTTDAAAAPWRSSPEAAPSPREMASVRALPGASLSTRATGEYVLSAGTAFFEGQADVRVETAEAAESFHVNGRALLSTEPSVAIEHVTDFVTPTPEVTHMIQTAKTHWLTAALAVMVFQGEVLAADGAITAGTHRAKQPTAIQPMTAKQPAAGRELDPEVIRDVMERGGRAFAPCYESALSQNQKLEGRITLAFTIGPNGTVSESTIEDDYSLHNPFVSACVLQALNTVTFPASKEGVSTKARVPMLFAPGSLEHVVDRGEQRATQGRQQLDPGASPMVGAREAKVTVVLFSEAASPFGVAANGLVKPLEAEYAGKVRFVYKHATREEHAAGRVDALAAQAAHNQGHFWDYLELIAKNPTSKQAGRYEAYARALGLDVPRFTRDLESAAVAAAVDADLEVAKQAGVHAAPTWFINGKAVAGHQSIEALRAAIDAELK